MKVDLANLPADLTEPPPDARGNLAFHVSGTLTAAGGHGSAGVVVITEFCSS